jgi:hypothetical protein
MPLFGRGEPPIALDLHLAQDDVAVRAAWDSVRAGDWTAARDLMSRSRGDYDRRARYLWVLGESVTDDGRARLGSDPNRTTVSVDTTAAWPDRWAEAEPDNPDAILVRSRSLIVRGWAVRGSDWASTVGEDASAEFHRLLLRAVPLCHQAANLTPQDPTPWVQLLLLATALGAERDDFDGIWTEVVARDPLHREAHNFKLMYLCQKWRGSHEEMFAFAWQAARSAPDGSPLHVLPVQASAEWDLWQSNRVQPPTKVTQAWREDPGFRAGLDNALRRWFTAGPVKHAMWYHDLNHLAYGLYRAGRHAEARPVFEAIGSYAEAIPWTWIDGHPERTFLKARKQALRT